MGIILLIIFVIICIFLIKFVINNYRFKFHCITFFQADVGGGKTAIKTHLALQTRKRRKLYNFFVPVLNLLVWFVPILHIYLLVQVIRKKFTPLFKRKSIKIYSTYPIWINKKEGFSYVIDRNFYTWDYKIEDSSIVCTDEMGYLMPSKERKAEPLENFTLTWIRHACNPTIFASSQNLGECLKVFRNKTSHVYELISCERVPFFHIFGLSRVYVKEILQVENMVNVYDDNQKGFKDNIYYFIYPKRNFDSRYGKDLYSLEKKSLQELANEYDELLKKLGLKCGDKWPSLSWSFSQPQK